MVNHQEMDLVENITVTAENILEALQDVMDPEIPALSVIDLGIIGDVTIKDDSVQVKMIPTFTACPATKLIRELIHEKVSSLGFNKVSVEVDPSIAWTSDRITENGKRKLEKFGLGTPEKHDGKLSPDRIEHSKCPHCGSENTTMNSLFGSTLCRSIHYCFDCKQGFERFKPL